jgi:hypothetical protein
LDLNSHVDDAESMLPLLSQKQGVRGIQDRKRKEGS